MDESEDAMSGTTVAQTKTSSGSDKVQKRTSSGREGRGYRVNARNNTRYSSASTNKNYKGVIEAFGDLITMKYEKLELKKFLDVFRGKLINYTEK